MWWLVSPNPHDLPAISAESRVRVAVALLVRNDLSAPELGILFGPSRMLWAAVPKAPVDEDGDTRSGENDVGNPSRLSQQGDMDAETESKSMKRTTQRRFGRGVLLPNALHSTTRFRR
jgi:hypothetical protein